MVGKVAVGGDNPIRVQSMTTTLTKDIDATVAQAARLYFRRGLDTLSPGEQLALAVLVRSPVGMDLRTNF